VPLLTLQRVSLAFGHLPLFDDADLQVEPGERIALIGRNGTGKSSLLTVIAGEVPPDAGSIWRAPGLRVARLEQEVPAAGDRSVFDEVADGLGTLGALVADYHRAAMELAEVSATDAAATAAAMARLGRLQQQLEEADGWRLEQKVELVVSRLSLPADRPLRELSGGWRRRALLGKALVSSPDLLLLDEPTNHLDIDAIRWLEEYLRDHAGALLFVTHDRAFLSLLATRIVELDRGRLTSWPGNYANFLEKKAAALDAEARELERLDRKLAKEEAWIRQGVKARRTRNEGRVKALHALRAERAAYRAQGGAVRMSLDVLDASGRLVFEADGVSKSLGGVPIIRNYSQRIVRGDRIGLIGPNGSGKTTLLRLLVGELQPDAGEIRRGTRLAIAYFDQQREQLDPDATVADSVNDGNTTVVLNGQPRHVIGYLADFLFPRERAQSPVRTLSGGERNRLMLARLFAKPANVLVLDEPTNDLDIETLELLEELIGAFDGTVLLVSHDRVFLENIVTSTLAFEGEGRVVEYVGGYEDYLRQSRVRDPGSAVRDPGRLKPDATGTRTTETRTGGSRTLKPVATETSTTETRTGGSRTPDPGSRSGDAKRKLSYKEQRELESLPAHIEALESEQERLKHESTSPEFYKERADHIRAVLARLEALEGEIQSALARWVELEERA
jgi:ATP-binding cassette subfamily F protein uup